MEKRTTSVVGATGDGEVRNRATKSTSAARRSIVKQYERRHSLASRNLCQHQKLAVIAVVDGSTKLARLDDVRRCCATCTMMGTAIHKEVHWKTRSRAAVPQVECCTLAFAFTIAVMIALTVSLEQSEC